MRRQQHGAGKIVGKAVRHLRDQVRGRRRDDDQIGLARETNVADVELGVLVEQIGEHALADQSAGRERRDELLRRLGQDHADMNVALLEPADQVERFIGGDAAANDEQGAACAGLRVTGALAPAPGRLKVFENLAAGLFARSAQQGADLVLHRAAVSRGAQPEFFLGRLVELTDSYAGHIEG